MKKRATATDETSDPGASATDSIPLDFEASMKRLGEIVDALERGDLSLEASLEQFEEGVRLARTSQARLDAAEARVEELMKIDEQGNPVVRPFEIDDDQ